MTDPQREIPRARQLPFPPWATDSETHTTDTSGWLARLGRRFPIDWPLKCFGSTTITLLFFWAYFWILANLDRPATVMPEIWLDHWIGFVPSAFPVYLALWLYVFLAPAVMGNTRALVWFGLGMGSMCLLSLAIFWWFPTRTPSVNIDWSLYPGLALIKGVDGAGNACPSLHVASAVFSLCWLHRIFKELRAPAALQWVSLVLCTAIIWSTMATLQHVALDVIAGTVMGFVFGAASLARAKTTA